MIDVFILSNENDEVDVPEYATSGASGADVRAKLE